MGRLRCIMAIAMGVVSTFGSGSLADGERFVFALTNEGQVYGIAESDVAKFMGIPYAAPPIGPARWRAPRQASLRTEILAANGFGSSCPQNAERTIEAPMSAEDCLTINIFSPVGIDDKLPVMVWIHGGELVSGASGDPLYDGSTLARDEVVVVTFNYRLGALGWLGDRALSTGDEDNGIGNYGMRDQIAALRWVRENIGAFGGDPGNVTIFGSSSGANAVAMLMISRRAAGLFQKAIIQSASFRLRAHNLDESEKAAKVFEHALGVSVEQMREVEPRYLLSVQKSVADDPQFSYGYTIDDVYVDEQFEQAISAGHEQQIPLLIGSNGFPYSPSAQSVDRSLVQKLLQIMERSDPGSSVRNREAARIRTDWLFSEPTRFVARAHSMRGSVTYRYLFDYVPETVEPPESGEEGQEIQFVFGTLGARPGLYSHRDREVSRMMRAYWTNFAKYGDPNESGMPAWRPQSARDDLLLISNSGVSCGPDPMKERLDLIAQVSRRP